MKIKIFGTCAAEGFPGMFCSCEVCEKARKWGGRNIRTRSQALVDGKLLIDFPADTYMHCLNYGLDLRQVEALLITHGHDDHLYPHDLYYRIHGYAYFPNEEKKEVLPVYATKMSGLDIRRLIDEEMVEERDKKSFEYRKITPYKAFNAAGFEVIPLKADHAFQLDPCIYIIKKDSKAMLWAHDTGYFPEETWKYIENSGIVFDFVSLDCTSILDDGAYGNHMGLKACSDVKARLLKKNATENTKFIVNHFSHNGGLCYDELVPVAGELGFDVSYDGIEFEF